MEELINLGCLGQLVKTAITVFAVWWIIRQLYERAEHAPCPNCGSRQTELKDARHYSIGTPLPPPRRFSVRDARGDVVSTIEEEQPPDFSSYGAACNWQCEACDTTYTTSGKAYHPTKRYWCDIYGIKKKKLEAVSPKVLTHPDERVFFNEGNVLVSSTRVSVSGKDHSISEIASVRKRSISPGRTAAILIMIFGLWNLVGASMRARGNPVGCLAIEFLLWLAVIVGPLMWLRIAGTKYQIFAITPSNEAVQLLTSPDKAVAKKVTGSINDAIAHRDRVV